MTLDLGHWTSDIINIFFPKTCTLCGCDIPDDNQTCICVSCASAISRIEGFICVKCGAPLPDGGEHCFNCKKNIRHHFEYIRSACKYEATVKTLIHKFKYKKRDYLCGFLSSLMYETAKNDKYICSVDYIVPVPMHWIKKLFRGFDQAELLAGSLAGKLNIPLLPDILIREKWTKPQFTFNRVERSNNIIGSFSAVNTAIISGKTLLLVDDVCTSCATIEECSKILKKAGARKIFALTLARD